MIPTPKTTPSQPRRIGVFRALQLGDMLCAVPALRSLRCAFPDAAITLIGLPWARVFAARFSHYVDAFIEFPGWPGLPERDVAAARIPAFLCTAQARDFDVVVQMHGDGCISNGIVAMLGARTVAGACAADAWQPENAAFVPYPHGAPERDRALAALQPLGVEPFTRALDFPVFDADRDELRQALAGDTVSASTVVVHPGARAESRRWPAVYFAAVADELAAHRHSIIITGSAEERALCDEVAANMHHVARVLAGETSLGALAALIESASLTVCNDTGVSHLADALGTPSVVLVTASDPDRWAPEDRTLHRVVRYPRTLDPRHALAEAHDLLQRRRAYAV